ncbi:hypothetical protein [Tautonia rosea]|uniref:hypothetical protein n=1 Tax=Tautonia rosea TaxID=2728037 RepID=UPI0014733082|nr:hypothetical protein [Tautonia rosea]
MRPFDDSHSMTPDERRAAIAKSSRLAFFVSTRGPLSRQHLRHLATPKAPSERGTATIVLRSWFGSLIVSF